MIMRYCPPMIFAHRVLYERGEQEVQRKVILDRFGPGGRMPNPEDRWNEGQISMSELTKWGIDKQVYGKYIGFRTREDQFEFFMTFHKG